MVTNINQYLITGPLVWFLSYLCSLWTLVSRNIKNTLRHKLTNLWNSTMMILKPQKAKKVKVKVKEKRKEKKKNPSLPRIPKEKKLSTHTTKKKLRLNVYPSVMTTMLLLSVPLLTKQKNSAQILDLLILLSTSTMCSLWFSFSSHYWLLLPLKCGRATPLPPAISTSCLPVLCALCCCIWLLSLRLDKLFLCSDTLSTTVWLLIKSKKSPRSVRRLKAKLWRLLQMLLQSLWALHQG